MTDNFDNIPEVLKGQNKWSIFEVVGFKPDGKCMKELRMPNGTIIHAGYPITQNMARFGDIIEICRKNPGKFYPGYHIEKGCKLLFGDGDKLENPPNYPTYTEKTITKNSYHVLSWYDGEDCPKLAGIEEWYVDGRWIMMTGDILDGKKDINYIPDLDKHVVSRTVKGEPHKLEENKKEYTEGERYPTLFRHARSDKCRNVPFEVALAAANALNELYFKPKCDAAYIRKAVEDAYKAEDSSAWKKDQVELKQTDISEIVKEAKDAFEPVEPISIQKLIKPDTEFDLSEIPNDNLIKMNMEYCNQIMDAYPEFALGNIMSMLSYITPSYMSPSFGNVYNNIWFINIAFAGQAGKSTSINVPLQIYTNLPPLNKTPLLSEKITPEAYVDSFAKDNIKLWIVDECSGLMKFLKRDYASEMKERLLQTYSHTEISRETVTKKNKDGNIVSGGLISCKSPHAAMLWYTTPEAFCNNTDFDDFLSGLYQRPLYINPRRVKEIMADRERTLDDDVKLNAITMRCNDLYSSTHDADVKFNENKLINDWKFEKRKKAAQENNGNSIENGGLTRNLEHVRKLAMIITIGSKEFLEYTNTIKAIEINGKYQKIIKYDIPDWAARTAIKMAEAFGENFKRVVTMVSENSTSNGINAKIVKKLIDGNGKATKQELQDTVKKYGKQWKDITDDLILNGIIKECKEARADGKAGKMKTYYVLLQLINEV